MSLLLFSLQDAWDEDFLEAQSAFLDLYSYAGVPSPLVSITSGDNEQRFPAGVRFSPGVRPKLEPTEGMLELQRRIRLAYREFQEIERNQLLLSIQ
jgi:hypothetical protein